MTHAYKKLSFFRYIEVFSLSFIVLLTSVTIADTNEPLSPLRSVTLYFLLPITAILQLSLPSASFKSTLINATVSSVMYTSLAFARSDVLFLTPVALFILHIVLWGYCKHLAARFIFKEAVLPGGLYKEPVTITFSQPVPVNAIQDIEKELFTYGCYYRDNGKESFQYRASNESKGLEISRFGKMTHLYN